jgi:hypothetical protein
MADVFDPTLDSALDRTLGSLPIGSFSDWIPFLDLNTLFCTNPNIFLDPNKDPNINLDPDTLLDSNILLYPNILWIQTYFWIQTFFWIQ